MGKTKKHENTFINKGLSIATFDHQIIFLPGSALSMNNQCFCWCFLCSCLKTLSLAPSLPLQALLLLLELVHLCPLRAEFRIGKAYPAEVSSSIYIYILYWFRSVSLSEEGATPAFWLQKVEAQLQGNRLHSCQGEVAYSTTFIHILHGKIWYKSCQILSDSACACWACWPSAGQSIVVWFCTCALPSNLIALNSLVQGIGKGSCGLVSLTKPF